AAVYDMRLGIENENLETRLAEKITDFESRLESQKEAHTTQLEQMRTLYQKQLDDTRASWEDQKRVVEQQFAALAGDVLDKKSEAFAKSNEQKMDAIINPLNEALKNMKETVESTRDQNNQNKASLEKAIEEVLRQSQSLGAEASRLANAMTSKNEVQGSWGETILREILDSQGLEEHKHYDLQHTLRDGSGKALLNEDSGKKMKPDAVVYYPDNKCVIIDSKVSLNAFIDYCNAGEDAAVKEDAIKRHLQSVRSHVKELSGKNYSAYVKEPYASLPYVIMFMPNDSALQLALCEDNMLWRDAFQQGVFITSEQNLVAALRMIELAWTQKAQAENHQQIFEQAQKLLDRVADFFSFMDNLGAQIDKTKDSYKVAYDKLRYSRQNILGAANNLIELGAKTSSKKKIPKTTESEEE
ncbi:MAG: DNA recombination protein RmuC, partial [Bacteroidales bacterium]|nr:DNA recombination protein RmuC [Bacteroidales bacterium]